MNPIESAAAGKSDELEPLVGGGAADRTFWWNVRAVVDHAYSRIITHGFHFEAPAPEFGQSPTGMSVGDLLRVR